MLGDYINGVPKEIQAANARLSIEEKRRLYAAGKYAFNPPAGPSAGWDDEAWVKHIDRHGQWLPKIKGE